MVSTPAPQSGHNMNPEQDPNSPNPGYPDPTSAFNLNSQPVHDEAMALASLRMAHMPQPSRTGSPMQPMSAGQGDRVLLNIQDSLEIPSEDVLDILLALRWALINNTTRKASALNGRSGFVPMMQYPSPHSRARL